MSRGSSVPPQLAFDHEPSDAELTQIVGPEFTTNRLCWSESDQQIQLRSPPFPFWRSFLAVVLMCLLISSWPWLLWWLFDKPVTIDSPTLYAILGFLWLLLVPVAYRLLLHSRDKVAARPCAIILHKQRRELELPSRSLHVSLDQVICFVDLRARRRHGQHISFYRQWGLVAQLGGQHVYVGFARLTAPNRRRNFARRLADYWDRPLRELKAASL